MNNIILVGRSIFSKQVEKYISLDDRNRVSIVSDINGFFNQNIDLSENIVVFTDYFQDYDYVKNKDELNNGYHIYEDLTPEAKNFIKDKFLWTGNIDDFLNYIENYVVEGSDFVPIKVDRFFHLRSLNCSIYLRLTGKKFVKLWNKDHNCTQEEVKKYVAKEIVYFYIKKDKFVSFTKFYLKNFEKIYEKSFDKDDKDYLWNKEYLGLIHDKISLLKIDVDTIGMVNDYSKKLTRIFQKSSGDILKTLEEMFCRPTDITQMTILLSYFAPMISKYYDWYTESTREKLIMGSLIHDLALVDSPHLLEKSFDTYNDLKSYNRKDREAIINHPSKILEKVDELQMLLPDVSEMIRCHHEMPKGGGYPRHTSPPPVSQITALFVICETFIYELLKYPESSICFKTIKSILEGKFNEGSYKKILEKFMEIIDKIFSWDIVIIPNLENDEE